MMVCKRCQIELEPVRGPHPFVIYFRGKITYTLCKSCMDFITDRFDDVIEEYILREE